MLLPDHGSSFLSSCVFHMLQFNARFYVCMIDNFSNLDCLSKLRLKFVKKLCNHNEIGGE